MWTALLIGPPINELLDAIPVHLFYCMWGLLAGAVFLIPSSSTAPLKGITAVEV
jgi:SAM-dependent MidA family methyltransferase